MKKRAGPCPLQSACRAPTSDASSSGDALCIDGKQLLAFDKCVMFFRPSAALLGGNTPFIQYPPHPLGHGRSVGGIYAVAANTFADCFSGAAGIGPNTRNTVGIRFNEDDAEAFKIFRIRE